MHLGFLSSFTRKIPKFPPQIVCEPTSFAYSINSSGDCAQLGVTSQWNNWAKWLCYGLCCILNVFSLRNCHLFATPRVHAPPTRFKLQEIQVKSRKASSSCVFHHVWRFQSWRPSNRRSANLPINGMGRSTKVNTRLTNRRVAKISRRNSKVSTWILSAV